MALAGCQAKEESLPREPEVPEGYKTLQINASYQETKSAYARVVDALVGAVPKSRQVALVSFRDD